MGSEVQDSSWKKCGISNKYPAYREKALKTVQSWFAGKKEDDNAEGLWRVHDGIYDVTDFISKHPGGPSWLEQTKGTDITEAFEAHHISATPAKLLEKYKIRDAAKPRNVTLTFKEDGFYKTLKGRVREKLKTIDYSPAKRSDWIHSALLVLTFLLAIETVVVNSYILAIAAGVFLCWTVISAHNYFHRRDNWRMYTFNFSLMSYKDWRVSHALSHHLYPNSFHDLELSLFEPFFCWVPLPQAKNVLQRYASWVYGPLLYSGTFLLQIVSRIICTLTTENCLYWDDLVAFILPAAMYVFSGEGFVYVLKSWFLILLVASFSFGLIGINAAHHHPNILHESDAVRDDRDWGLYQLDAVADRADLKGSQFLVLTHFGDHALHHLFPTLDHGILPQLYPVLYETMKEFKGLLKEYSWYEHIVGQHKQLARITPNEKKHDEYFKPKKQ